MADDFIGPVIPPMIAWQRAGEPGFPYHEPEWLTGERLEAYRARLAKSKNQC